MRLLKFFEATRLIDEAHNISSDMSIEFTCGACMFFAYVLNRQFGWPIAGTFMESPTDPEKGMPGEISSIGDYETERVVFGHAWAQPTDNISVDIDGATTTEKMKTRWSGYPYTHAKNIDPEWMGKFLKGRLNPEIRRGIWKRAMQAAKILKPHLKGEGLLEARLDELRQRYVDPDASGNRVVVAHRGNIWILNDGEVPAQVVADILQQTGAGNPGDIAGETVNVWDLQEMFENRPDIIFGQWSGDDFYVSDRVTGSLDVRSSPLYRQLGQHLGLSTATRSASTWTGDETEHTTWQHEMKGKLPDVLYHGTHTGNLSSILKTGLNPDSYESNWPEVGKFDLIFLTSKFEEASFQANRSADKNSVRGAEPIVLQVRVPDKDQITWDYDMAARYADPEEHPDIDKHGFTGTPSFHDQAEWQQNTDVNVGTNYMTATGTVGYKKRIPAKFIEGANVSDMWGQGYELGSGGDEGWIEHDNNYMTIDELKASFDRIQDHGYDPGEDYEPEEDEDEDDF